nr:MAG TPA: hypothetical protein [Bacteriophage sp.]
MDEENEDLTPEETEEIDENPEETPGEAHREGEFEDLRDRIEGIAKMIEQMNKNIAIFISSAGESADVDDEPPADVDLDEIPDVDEFDLSI